MFDFSVGLFRVFCFSACLSEQPVDVSLFADRHTAPAAVKACPKVYKGKVGSKQKSLIIQFCFLSHFSQSALDFFAVRAFSSLSGIRKNVQSESTEP